MNLNSKYFDIIRIYRPRTKAHAARHMCDWPGCAQTGPYPALVGADSDERRHFCFTHNKIYNKRFNFFAGMNERDIRAFHHTKGTNPAGTIGQKYKLRGSHTSQKWQDPFELFNYFRHHRPQPAGAGNKRATTRQARALYVLGLDEKSSPKTVKPRYKELVKRYHPDANGGDRSLEMKLNRVIQAYQFLQASGFC